MLYLFVGVASLGLGLGTARAAQATPQTAQRRLPRQRPTCPRHSATAQEQPLRHRLRRARTRSNTARLPAVQSARQPAIMTPAQPQLRTAQPCRSAAGAAAGGDSGAANAADSLYGDAGIWHAGERREVRVRRAIRLGSAYIPVDSWVYPAMMRLYSMGYLDTMYLSMRPYTRRSALHILQKSEDAILSERRRAGAGHPGGAVERADRRGHHRAEDCGATRGMVYGVQSVYTRVMGVSGSILQDSFHLGQTFFNDYGRPHEPGFNNITGFSTLKEQGPFSLYVRGEYQHAPGGPGYSQALSAQLSAHGRDSVLRGYNDPQATIPTGPIAAQNPFRLVEATLSYHILGHEISGGKSDAWLGPGMGGAMDWSNNAENIYSFRINRVEPLHIKCLSKLLGPVRYDFFYGSLKGHTYPNDDYVHSEMFSFQPTRDFQFGFQRTIVFGGEGHEPVTLHTFLKGFFDTNDTNRGGEVLARPIRARGSRLQLLLPAAVCAQLPDAVCGLGDARRSVRRSRRRGARHTGRGFISRSFRAPNGSTCAWRACRRTARRWSARTATTSTSRRSRSRPTRTRAYIMGDWIGREAKGGQAWLTYHLSGNEWVQVSYLNKKTPKDFIPGGTTQNQFRVDVVKRIGPDVEVNGVVPARALDGADLYAGAAEQQRVHSAGDVLPEAAERAGSKSNNRPTSPWLQHRSGPGQPSSASARRH